MSFSCQRCLEPIKIDKQLLAGIKSDEHFVAELTLPVNSGNNCNETNAESFDAAVASAMAASQSDPGLAVGYTLLGDKKSTDRDEWMIGGVFDAMTDTSLINHPMCQECTDALIKAMESELQSVEESKAECHSFLQSINDESDDNDLTSDGDDDNDVHNCQSVSTVGQLTEAMYDLQLTEDTLMARIRSCDERLAEAEAVYKAQFAKKEQLLKDEERYHLEINEFQSKMMAAEDQYQELCNQTQYAAARIAYLNRLNIFTFLFDIKCGPDQTIGSINRFRLGRTKSEQVLWSEINSALGYVALLLLSLAKAAFQHSTDEEKQDDKFNPFDRYQVCPLGPNSYVKTISRGRKDCDTTEIGRILPLVGGQNRTVRMLMETKFDLALAAIVDCLGQLASMLSVRHNFELPYEIDTSRGKLYDSSLPEQKRWLSVRLQFNSEDNWTRAMKMVLTDLQWAMTFVSNKLVS